MLSFVRRWRDIALLAPMFARAMSGSGVSRNFAEIFVAFALMVLALVLPLKTFIAGLASPGGPERTDLGAADKGRSERAPRRIAPTR
jgi:hypothetical protein